jgi:hypothetical protein
LEWCGWRWPGGLETVRRSVARRGAGEPVDAPVQRPKLIDPLLSQRLRSW